uniref:Uncharacterized protein n=1 Tax=Kuenenia stuttgartiensis TaxID=174633 RepID=Q1PWD4_KUEST|nr:hypothetical protein kustc0801 [Candidatus Kuenenia stuttgartiensis]
MFFIEMVNLLSGVFCYQYTAEYLGNPTISILFLQQGFALFAGFRFKVLKTLDELCKKYRMGVSINEREHLYTFSPERPLNFWFYNPQHEFDKAPVRK